jgi:serine phosphatase RsbU (regulator of sigma subunit)
MVLWRKKPTEPSARSQPEAVASEARRGSTETISNAILSGDPMVDGKSLDVLLDAIRHVSESRDVESLLQYVVDTATQTMGAERGFLVLIQEDGTQVVRVARAAGQDLPEGERAYSTSVVHKVVSTETPLRTTEASDAQALELGHSVFQLKLRGVMCAPLTPQGRDFREESSLQRGALYVDSKVTAREFTSRDLALFSALAQHIAVALENARLNAQSLEKMRLERSLEIATEIQAGLMPSSPPDVKGFELYGWFRPAEHATGDFYDFVRLGDGRQALVIGDVTGHGIGPALITATAQAGLRSYLKILTDPAQVVTMLNADLAERMDDGMFLTLFLGVFSEEGDLEYVNAGHTPPLLWRHSDQTIEDLPATGPALGLMDDMQYEVSEPMVLNPGDTLLAFTDGLVEARHHDRPERFFGEQGVRAILAELGWGNFSAEDLTEQVVAGALEFSGGEREDDMTLVTLSRAGGQEG